MSQSTGKFKLLDSDEEEDNVQLTVNSDYATKYDNWRKKEEYQKLKDKYGEGALSEGSELSGSDDSSGDSDQEELQMQIQGEEFHRSFINTLTALKKGDPSLLDPNVSFVPRLPTASSSSKERKPKKMTLMDYHVKLVKERKGVTEEDEEQSKNIEPGYYEQLDSIRDEFKAALNDSSDDESDTGLIKKVKKIDPIESKSTTSSPIPLEEPKDDDEKFLFDYIIKKKYLDDPTVNFDSNSLWKKKKKFYEDSEEEATDTAIQVKDHRFEESGAGELKRFPRGIESARDLGIKEDRAAKRKEIKERKKKEKEEDLKKFTNLRASIMEDKLKKLKEISGNDKFVNKNLSKNIDMKALLDIGDFDPDKHDANMMKLFGDDYYKDEDTEKPQFEFMEGIDDDIPECDEDGHFLSVPNDEVDEAQGEGHDPEEDEEFEIEGSNKLTRPEKKKRKRARDKKKEEKKRKKIDIDEIPDYDDVISGALPIRFKYRKVKPNDFGLTPEEILNAQDKELNAWVSLKKAVGFRPDDEEERDHWVYQRKGKDWNHKKKVLASLFMKEGEEDHEDEGNHADEDSLSPKKKRKRRRKNKLAALTSLTEESQQEDSSPPIKDSPKDADSAKKLDLKEKRKRYIKKTLDAKKEKVMERLQAYGLTKNEIRKKRLGQTARNLAS
jgi:protein KRI1